MKFGNFGSSIFSDATLPIKKRWSIALHDPLFLFAIGVWAVVIISAIFY